MPKSDSATPLEMPITARHHHNCRRRRLRYVYAMMPPRADALTLTHAATLMVRYSLLRMIVAAMA